MALTEYDQIKQAIQRSTNILITTAEKHTTDAITSALALYAAAQNMKKKAKVVCANFSLPPNHSFLPKSKEIERELTALRTFNIVVDTRRTKVDQLSYDMAGDELRIYLQPKDGFFESRDVTTTAGAFAYDLIITVDTPDLAALGPIAEHNAEFFYHTPIINIDHHPDNERYGQYNLVNVTATSSSELVFELLQAIDPKLLDEYIATHLLTGIISKTKSFQSATVTPRALRIASLLVASGARREEIVQHLYRTKSVATLQIWGRVLSKLHADAARHIVWASVTKEELDGVQASPSDLRGIIDELIVDIPEAKSIVILYEEKPRAIRGIVSTTHAIDALTILSAWSPKGTRDFTEIRADDASLADVENGVLDALRRAIG